MKVMVQEHCSLLKKTSTMPYKDKLKDSRWIEFAKKVYARDGWSCGFDCGWTSEREIPLVAHHKVYYVDRDGLIVPWDYSLGDMQTLCKTCHDVYHKSMGISVPIIDKKSGRIINEDKATRKTRLAIEEMKRKEKSNA